MKNALTFNYYNSYSKYEHMIQEMGEPSFINEEFTSFYWKDENYFYRCSDHWGKVKDNIWELDDNSLFMLGQSDYVVCFVPIGDITNMI